MAAVARKLLYEAYTDGSCLGNPGPGGFAALVRTLDESTSKLIKSQQVAEFARQQTTNNQMELKGAIAALQLVPRGSNAIVYVDSKYVHSGITQWISNWKRRNWQTVDKKPVLNMDLWKELDELVQHRKTKWTWVKAHAGNEFNEQVDKLARAQSDLSKKHLEETVEPPAKRQRKE